MSPEHNTNLYEAPHTETPPVSNPQRKGLGGFAIWLLTGVGMIAAGLMSGWINSPTLGTVIVWLVLFWGSWIFVKPRWQGTGVRIGMVIAVAVLFAISYVAIFFATCIAIFATR